jgi:pimeloyl-ACP methyl ester carboxylesterase
MTEQGLLTHRVEGEGPPVVLLNGGMMTFPAWEAIAARLRPSYRVLRFDFRGQLLSPGTAPADLAGHARDVAALLDHLGWEAAHLVGTSFGALVALELAAQEPGRALSLVAITAMDRETPEFRRDSEAMRAVLATIREGGERGSFYDRLIEGVYSASYRRSEAAILAARKVQVAQLPAAWYEGVDQLLAALEGFDFTDRLSAIRGPALAILAADDRVMEEGRARALAHALGASIRVHPTSGHVLVAEDPDWLAGEVLAFLDQAETFSPSQPRVPTASNPNA